MMKQVISECDSYLIDTYKVAADGVYVPAVIVFNGRKRVDSFRWAKKQYPSQQQADDFVRKYLSRYEITELENEGQLPRSNNSRYTRTFSVAY